MSTALRKIWNICSTVLVVAAVIVAVALAGVRLVGIKTYAVLSGSMEPTYPTGSLLYVKSIAPEKLQIGDSITYMLDEDTVVTHRIIEIVPDESDSSVIRFRTKGDANNAADGAQVHCNNVIGKPIFCIPYFGYFASFIQTPPGLYLAIGAAAILLVLVFLPDLFKNDGDSKKEKAPHGDAENNE